MNSLMIYVFMFLTITILYKIAIVMKKKNKYIGFKFFKLLSIIVFAFFVCFRYNVGTDFFNYMDFYDYCAKIPLKEIFQYRMEPGAIVLYKISYLISSNPITIIYTMSFVITIATYILLDKIETYYGEKLDSALSLVCFLFLFLPFCLNGMRQGIAILFGLISILEFIHDKKKLSFIYLILAILFHSSAIILLVYFIFYLLNKKNNVNGRIILFSFILGIILYLSPTLILKFSFFEKFNIYLTSTSSMINKSYVVLLLLNLPLFILILLFKNKISNDDSVLSSLWISSQILYFFCSFSTFLNRISLYFEVICLILIPMLLYEKNNKKNYFIKKLLCFAYLFIYFYIHFYIFKSHSIFPYQNSLFR